MLLFAFSIEPLIILRVTHSEKGYVKVYQKEFTHLNALLFLQAFMQKLVRGQRAITLGIVNVA